MLMPMMALKSCRRCSGDMVLVEDEYSVEYHCLQCGRAVVIERAEKKRRVKQEA